MQKLLFCSLCCAVDCRGEGTRGQFLVRAPMKLPKQQRGGESRSFLKFLVEACQVLKTADSCPCFPSTAVLRQISCDQLDAAALTRWFYTYLARATKLYSPCSEELVDSQNQTR